MTDQAPPIRVAIIEDQREIREGLKTLVAGTPGYCVAGAWRSMEEALDGIARDVPDVALVDIGLPGMPGTDGIRILRERYPKLRTLMLTVYDDDERIFDAICAGASGYLLKSTPPVRLQYPSIWMVTSSQFSPMIQGECELQPSELEASDHIHQNPEK